MIGIALLLFLVAAVIGWVSGPGTVEHAPRQRLLEQTTWLLATAGCVLLVVAGSAGLAGYREQLGFGSIPGMGSIGLRLDPLSGLFLVITFGAGALVMLAALARPVQVRDVRRRLPVAAVFVAAAAAVVILAGDLFLLLAGWEALGFAFYLAVGYDRHREARGRASLLAAGFSKVSGGLLLAGGGLLAVHAGSITLSAWGANPGLATTAGYMLLIAGFGVKVGLVPAHVWLPPAYTAAPGPVRALLAGAAVNVGFYGLWRTLAVLGPPPVWLACAVLLVAGLSALLGISHAAVHADLRGLVAWSSVENAGIITAGYGVALVGAIAHSTPLMAVGLLAGTMQVITHAAAKSLLFVSTSAVEDECGTTDLDRLRGIARRLPVTGAGMTVGALTLAGMPLTAGFASEWMTLEALMQQFRVDELPLQLCMAIAGIFVALTIGVSGVAFVRLIGLTVFTRNGDTVSSVRDVGRRRAGERSWAHRTATIVLSALCLGVAMFAPFTITVIAAGLAPIVGDATRGALAGNWILQPVFPGFSALSPTLLWIVIPAYAVITVLLAVAFSGRRFWQVRRTDPWRSAGVGVPGRAGYTSYAYANPIRRVLAGLLGTRREVRPRTEAVTTDGGEDAPVISHTTPLDYRVDVTDVFQRYLYRPLLPATRAVVAAARRLQSGRLDAYMAYMLVALLAVIAVVVALV